MSLFIVHFLIRCNKWYGALPYMVYNSNDGDLLFLFWLVHQTCNKCIVVVSFLWDMLYIMKIMYVSFILWTWSAYAVVPIYCLRHVQSHYPSCTNWQWYSKGLAAENLTGKGIGPSFSSHYLHQKMSLFLMHSLQFLNT